LDGHGARERRWITALPWLAGLAGALLVLRPLAAAPGRSALDNVFFHDTLCTVDALRAAWLNLGDGPGGRGWLDWIYAGRFFFPQPRVLATSELMPLAVLAGWPLSSHPVLAHNVLLAAALVLDCVAGASLARTLGSGPRSAAAGGAAFAFSSYTAFQLGRLQLLFLFPMVFGLAAAVRWADRGRARDGASLILWFAAQALLCLYYAAFAAVLLAVAVPAARLARSRPGASWDLAILALAAVAVLAPLAVPLAPYADLSRALGLGHAPSEIVEQSGDPAMFLWADRSTPWGGVLRDVFAWDTAYFPGAVALLSALAGAAYWTLRDVRARWPVAALAAAGALLLGPAGPWAPFAGLVLAGAHAAWLCRRGRAGMAPAVLILVAAAGLVLFAGPVLKLDGRVEGPAPYARLLRAVPFFSGIRMIRRAGFVVDLAVAMAAALALTRLERLRHGGKAVLVLGLVAALEGMPLHPAAREVPGECPDPAFDLAAQAGAVGVGEIRERPPTHAERSALRFAADSCRIATTEGHASFVPPLSRVVADSLERLPAADAHAWLWDAQIRHVVLRRAGASHAWAQRREQELASIAASVQETGGDLVFVLSQPALPTFLPLPRLAGAGVPLTAVDCSVGAGCSALADGNERTLWSSRAEQAPGQTVVARFSPARVAGFEWHARGVPGDLPRALDVWRLTPEGTWVRWRSLPSLSMLGLGRHAVDASMAIELPPETAAGIRFVQTGGAAHYWWSGSELRVVRPAETAGAAAAKDGS